jgi:hypothetical protein
MLKDLPAVGWAQIIFRFGACRAAASRGLQGWELRASCAPLAGPDSKSGPAFLRYMQLDWRFALTPALSPREREPLATALGRVTAQ